MQAHTKSMKSKRGKTTDVTRSTYREGQREFFGFNFCLKYLYTLLYFSQILAVLHTVYYSPPPLTVLPYSIRLSSS